MTPERAATGVLKKGDWGDSMWYHVQCDCGSEDCAHDINIEADDCHVQVHIYHVQHTKWWEKNRWQQIWQILTKGYAEMQTTIVLDEQTALNYADNLVAAMDDVKEFRSNRK